MMRGFSETADQDTAPMLEPPVPPDDPADSVTGSQDDAGAAGATADAGVAEDASASPMLCTLWVAAVLSAAAAVMVS